MNERRHVERYIPHRCVRSILRSLETAARNAGDAEDAEEIVTWIADLTMHFPPQTTVETKRKLTNRLNRAVDIANRGIYDRNCGIAMSAMTHLMQTLINEGAWEPDDALQTVWGKLSDATYNRCGNGALLNEVDMIGSALAAQALEALRREGYYQGGVR